MINRHARVITLIVGRGIGLLVCLGLGTASGENDRNSGDFWKSLGSDDWPTLYKDKKGAIEEWKLLGRFDLQYGSLDSDHGNEDKFDIRRLRIGTQVKFLDDWRIKVVASMVNRNSITYSRLDSAYLGYYPSKHLKFKLGKQMAHFGQEWSTPSQDLRVIERSLLVQQLHPRKSTGLMMAGDWNNWDFELGVFAGDLDREFSNLDAGFFYLANIGYDLTGLFDGWKNFDLRFYYLHNDGDSGNTGVRPYEHSISTAINLRKKQFRLAAEAIYADGMKGRPDAWGFLISPSWELIDDKLDLVVRYHYAKSEGPNGLRLRSRYETLAPTLTNRGRGEEYQSLYVGLKYYLLDDRLVFMTGAQWSEMQDDFGDGGDLDAFSFLSALRLDF